MEAAKTKKIYLRKDRSMKLTMGGVTCFVTVRVRETIDKRGRPHRDMYLSIVDVDGVEIQHIDKNPPNVNDCR